MWKYLLLLLSVHLLGRLPLRVLYGLAAVAGDLAYFFAPPLRHNVWDNMRHVMGPDTPKKKLRRAARQVFRNIARYYVDLIRMPHLNLDQFFQRRLTYHGFEEHLLPAIHSGKGVIIASGHFGNAELAVQGLLVGGVKVVVLTEPLNPPALSRLIDGVRTSKGHTFLPVSFASVKTVVRTIKTGGVVALMCDRDIEGKSIRVPFCGTPARVPVGAVELAMRTGATIVPAFNHRTDGNGIEVFLESPLELASSGDSEADLKENVQRLLGRFEPHLRRDPGQWAVLEAVWEDGEDGNDTAAPSEEKR
jgi:KDO2-lipid IV(A) lauroyltransferase